MSDKLIYVESIAWQDYRASNSAMVLYYNSDPVSEIPIREVPEEFPSDVIAEPNYETKTYGLFGCSKSKFRGNFVKSKIRYLFFLTKYDGTNADYKGKIFITGYYRVVKTADVKKNHIRNLADYSCLNEDSCYALRADELRFVAIEDAFEVTNNVLKAWDYKARITRQTKVVLSEELAEVVLTHLKSKPDATESYINETQRLQPHSTQEEQGEEE